MNWSKRWPLSEGFYWAYGQSSNPHFQHGKELIFVKVRRCQNSFMYIGEGRFLYEQEMDLVWQVANLPEVPNE